MDFLRTKVGVLGGGQLGRMLCQAAQPWNLPLAVLDRRRSYPAGGVAGRFVEGDFTDFDDVLAFGQELDVLTIEIENVNVEALKRLEAEGVRVYPQPEALATIKDKGLQKLFYNDRSLPAVPFRAFEDARAIERAVKRGRLDLPFVQKTRLAGYDGRGVSVVRSEADLPRLLPGPCIVEPLVDIRAELAVLAARRPSGETAVFPAVEMVFHPTANLVEFLACPARIPEEVERRAEELALKTIQAFGLCGLLAVEMFWTRDDELLINEVAPRPHNSGHHTLDACITSQFEQHLRAILDLPLGSTRLKCPAVMVNLLGAPGSQGPAHYLGIEQCLAMEGVKIHLYGKEETRPFRKMGHATVLDEDLDRALERARQVKDTLKIVAPADVA
ncbi:MAG: 5-(carboxyamino)imidazole ribonucleotide synthase [Bacteroidetes bacterium]|nr:MAG: 5-(carboxyamino)imidazole ribonucleotide synthase [Bacteroidota bacterium]